MSVLNVTLLDALQALVELGNNRTRVAILRDDIGLVVVEVIDLTQRRANGCSTALGCLVNLGKLEEILPGVVEEIKAEREALMASIEVQ